METHRGHGRGKGRLASACRFFSRFGASGRRGEGATFWAPGDELIPVTSTFLVEYGHKVQLYFCFIVFLSRKAHPKGMAGNRQVEIDHAGFAECPFRMPLHAGFNHHALRLRGGIQSNSSTPPTPPPPHPPPMNVSPVVGIGLRLGRVPKRTGKCRCQSSDHSRGLGSPMVRSLGSLHGWFGVATQSAFVLSIHVACSIPKVQVERSELYPQMAASRDFCRRP